MEAGRLGKPDELLDLTDRDDRRAFQRLLEETRERNWTVLMLVSI